jgi:hypothetical protein
MITIKPNKEETKLLNWLNKARSTDPKGNYKMKSPRVLKIGKYRIHVRIFKPHYVSKDICPTWGIVRHLFSVVIVGAFFSVIIFW